MATRYIDPLAAAYRRMKAALFRPFDLGTWFVLGFASWIAGWGPGGGAGYRGQLPGGRMDGRDATPEEAFGNFARQVADVWADPTWRFVIVAAVPFVLALGVLIVWINARGEFVYLDAVLNQRKAIVAPWHAWSVQGNSLFVWRLVVGLIMLSAFTTLSVGIFFLATGGRIPRALGEVPLFRVAIGFSLAWIPFAVFGVYLHLFVRHFITPIMYRDRSTTMDAWRTFWPILSERLGAFVGYGLFLLVLHIGIFLAMIPAICLTCCLLGCLMAIPFVGAVVWLPVSYTLRGFGPEFLAQYGTAYDVWPRSS